MCNLSLRNNRYLSTDKKKPPRTEALEGLLRENRITLNLSLSQHELLLVFVLRNRDQVCDFSSGLGSNCTGVILSLDRKR